jgi:hypothetical protein
MLRAGVWRPCIYSDRSDMTEIKQSLLGLPRGSYRLWVANPDGVAEIPAGYDAKQYRFNPGGHNYDLSVCRDDFFQPPTHRKPPPKPHPKPHPKVVGSTAGAALAAGIVAVLHAAGVHITPVEASAISTIAAALSGYVTPSKP